MPLDVARIATMNTQLLKELSLEEVLEIHPLVNAQNLPYTLARKTKSIRARPINTILDKSDPSIWEKLLLATLEGQQSLKRDSFICWGVDNDVWQQAGNKLHAKYTPTEVDVDGWITFVPKEGSDAVMLACQITEGVGPHDGFSLVNPWWGDERILPSQTLCQVGLDRLVKDDSAVKVYLHYGVAGDCILMSQTDSLDTYRVARKFFEATYELDRV